MAEKNPSRYYSIIIPVYNRPQELRELLESLTRQTFTRFEVIVVDDGSEPALEEVINSFKDRLQLKYYYKKNSGQGFSRNYGFERAEGDYFIVFDSDCLVPEDYLLIVDQHLNQHWLDAYGGPDQAASGFTVVQKAINFSMTSFLTTGGIRGRGKTIGPYHPRSFNMGLSREVFEATKGYILPQKGEDIEFAIRIIKAGFTVGLIKDAFVYHKRRTSLVQFFKQLHFFGRARVNVGRYHPEEVRFVHYLPVLFVMGLLIWIGSFWFSWYLFLSGALLVSLFFVSLFIQSTVKNRSIAVGLATIPTAFFQLFAYGLGFIREKMGL